MPWSDDIRCLYCDGRLPLYRKITNGQFCSTAHRKAYWQEQERLAVERLHQTHDTLRAYRPSINLDIESVIGSVPEPEPEVLPVPVHHALDAERPWWMPMVNAGEVPVPTFLPNPWPTKPCWTEDALAGGPPEPLDYSRNIRRPFAVYRALDCGFEFARAVAPEVHAAKPAANCVKLAPIDVIVDPVTRVKFEIQPEFDEFDLIEEDIPPFAELVTLAQPRSKESAHGIAGAMPLEITMRAQLPLDQVVRRFALAPAALVQAGLRQLPMDQIALVQGPWIDHLRALDLGAEMDAPLFTLATPPVRPRLRLAAGRRYAVSTRDNAGTVLSAGPQTFPLDARDLAMPQRNAKVLRANPAAKEAPQAAPAPSPAQEPNPAGLTPLPMLAKSATAAIKILPAPQPLAEPQTPRPEPLRPRGRFEPLNHQVDHPSASPSLTVPALTAPELAASVSESAATPEHHRLPAHLGHLVDFWNRAPRDLKLLVFAIPLLLGLAMHPALPKVRVAAPAKAASLQRDFEKAWNEQLVSVKQSVTDRAAIALDEDFRSGLDDWVSRGDATTEWSFDATGFVRPGPLALYRPSMALTDYEFQFLGLIDKKALSWVARAADFNNFYVIKLVVLKGGPLPTIGVTRYAVVNGKADERVDRIAPLDAREDMLYRVRLNVYGDEFALTVQGQLVDAWSEPRLAHGGIGFFTSRGEESRVRWVQVTHQYDMLGRLCAYLAPYNITQASTGSWQQ